MERIGLLLGFVLLMSCAGLQKPSTLVLDYQDFGPPVVAHELIGMDWWQWQDHGDSRPGSDPIKVVVYRNVLLAEVKSRYPVNPELEHDYRYLEYARALQYLDRVISENVLEYVTQKLKTTRREIESSLGSEAAEQAY